MPLFPKKSHHGRRDNEDETVSHNVNSSPTPPSLVCRNGEENEKPKVVFHCQQAQGSPTGIISGFTNIIELYQKISECYDFSPDEILFCTLNTHKIDMTKLLGSQIGLDDFIFVHRKGQSKEIELRKTEDALGLTITDNGNGYAFIRRIREGSVIDKVPVIQVGDHIERINGESVVGKRHFEVAKILKDIRKGFKFTMRLVEPLKAGFSYIGPRGDPRQGKKAVYGSGKETLRFKAGGGTVVEVKDDIMDKAVEKVNSLLENYIGINDTELATRIWEISIGKTNSMDFAEAIDNSDLEELGFSDDFIIEIWGVITDVRDGRI